MTIDEILAAMPEPAAEGDHDYLVIDPVTRTITVPDSELLFGVTGDELADRKYFLCPRYVGDGLDLAAMFIRVNFRNAGGEEDGYLVNDVAVTPDGDYITFSWQLWPKVAAYVGTIQFGVCADLPNATDRKMPDWNTTLATGEVLEGLHPALGDVEAETSDVVTQLREEIAASTEAVEACGAEQIQAVKNAAATETAAAEEQIAAKGVETLATIPADYTTLANKTNEQANAIKGHLAGEIIRAGDVSPVEHFLGVKVRGKNLWNMAVITSADGKFVNNGDGTITVNGGEYYCRAAQTLAEICPQLRVGDVVKFTISTTAYAGIFLNVANTLVQNGYALTITADMLASYVALYGVLDTDETYNEPHTINWIQLELGTVATEYTPYVDPAGVTVTRCGKNLFNVARACNSFFVANEDGSHTFTMGSKAGERFSMKVPLCLPAGVPFYFSTDFLGHTVERKTLYMIVRHTDGTESYPGITFEEKRRVVTFSKPTTSIQFYLQASEAVGAYIKLKNFQIELGEAATDYETYNATTAMPAEDGTVAGLPSAAPTMTLLTDTPGVTVECSYNRDSNAVLAEVLAKIAALSG